MIPFFKIQNNGHVYIYKYVYKCTQNGGNDLDQVDSIFIHQAAIREYRRLDGL